MKIFFGPMGSTWGLRVPNLAPNRGIFSKVNGIDPLGSGGYPITFSAMVDFIGDKPASGVMWEDIEARGREI